MGKFYVDDKYTFKEEQKFWDQNYVVFFSFLWWKTVWAMELDDDVRLQEASNFPS